MKYEYINKEGDFQMEQPEQTSYLYLPLVNAAGVMASITPDGHGDSKLGQDEFLMEPVTAESLHMSSGNRNFWCKCKGEAAWSVTGCSAAQQALRYSGMEEKTRLRAGMFWQEVVREQKNRFGTPTGLKSIVKNFCPVSDTRAEIMMVRLENEGSETLTITPTVAIPLFARGADHIRDHRHVTSLLNRTEVTETGVCVTPAMSFDERGHHLNERSYGVYAKGQDGTKILGAFPVMEEFIGEGGTLLWPEAVVSDESKVPIQKPGSKSQGYEAMGALRFPELELKPGTSFEYVILLSYDGEGMEYLEEGRAVQAFETMKQYWQEQKSMTVYTGNDSFDGWMKWVCMQPLLRRIYGCSFLPHHDYGRGGRGWRDLWQDCLALILMDPKNVREDLAGFFAGVRADGSNATIIGSRAGEFKADRNNIVRVWMDHGYWPFFTVRLYLDQTGDYEFLLEEQGYFKDRSSHRGEGRDEAYCNEQGTRLLCADGTPASGTVLEHLLTEQVTQFFDVGEHNHMRLRGADWNDALDMAWERGESVAFTAAYSHTLKQLAQTLRCLETIQIEEVRLAEELMMLLDAPESMYEHEDRKQALFARYCDSCEHCLSGRKTVVPVKKIASILERMSMWIQRHIRRMEFVEDSRGNGWFNGYYDNCGRRVEGELDGQIRMMLTSQVFMILSGTATDEQITKICHSADTYLYEKSIGGYRLNTDFQEVKLDMGRLFGFAYGHKENGAVFSHMAVMYAYALYERGFVKEGYRVISSLFEQSMNFDVSRIYPGIPEYFNQKGRGMYSYLTGAASWLVFTVLTQMYGIKGEHGNLMLHPKLLKEQFDSNGRAEIQCCFAGKKLKITYVNGNGKEIGDYEITEITVNGQKAGKGGEKGEISRAKLTEIPGNEEVIICVLLESV